MYPEYDRGSENHAYIIHDDQVSSTQKEASEQCSDNYNQATLPILDTVSKHRAALAKILKSFGELDYEWYPELVFLSVVFSNSTVLAVPILNNSVFMLFSPSYSGFLK